MTVAHADIAEPTDRIGSFSRKALAASAIGYAMDGFDLLILGFMLRAISAELHLTPPQAGSLITWTLIGAVAGGILFGMLSDYYGRVRVLTWTILLFAVFTGLGALAQGYWDLLFYRTIAGLGLGGEFGIGMALVAEAWPANIGRVVAPMWRSAGRPACWRQRSSLRSFCPSSAGAACSWSLSCPASSPLRFAGMCRSRRYSWIVPRSAARPCRSAFW